MIGLTDEERAFLSYEGEATFSKELINRMVSRGLAVRTGECFHCDRPEGHCDCGGDFFDECVDTTDVGLLALRLDAAARSVGTVTA